MQIETDKKLFTRDNFTRMFEAGILDEDQRWELIDGEVIKMTNPGRRHIACTNRITKILVIRLGDRAMVSIQNPFVLDDYNEPKPDVVVARARDDFYASEELAVDHSVLVVEISDTTLWRDRRRKLPNYARLGVPEFWILDLKHDRLMIYRDPVGSESRTHLTLGRGESVTPVIFPDIPFKVEELLGS